MTSTARACALLGKPRASHYRAQQPVNPAQRSPRPAPPNALTVAEQDAVIAALTSPRFCDKPVAQTWATLLDEGVYLASMSTIHRLLRLIGHSGERRNQASHPTRARPELMATKPGQDGTGTSPSCAPQRGVYYDLYVILDIYSRYVVAWTVAARKDADIAKNLIDSAAQMHGASDTEPPRRENPVAPARRSEAATRKASRRRDAHDQPVRSFRSLLEHLATLTRNDLRYGTEDKNLPVVPTLALPTATQRRAFELLDTAIPLTLK